MGYHGKYEGAPEWAEYFWEQIVLNGFGEDREDGGRTVTYISIDEEDVKRFPELKSIGAPYLALWVDEQGFVHCGTAQTIPEDSTEEEES